MLRIDLPALAGVSDLPVADTCLPPGRGEEHLTQHYNIVLYKTGKSKIEIGFEKKKLKEYDQIHFKIGLLKK